MSEDLSKCRVQIPVRAPPTKRRSDDHVEELIKKKIIKDETEDSWDGDMDADLISIEARSQDGICCARRSSERSFPTCPSTTGSG